MGFKNFTEPEGAIGFALEVQDLVWKSEFIPRPCFNCPIACAYDTVIGRGPYKGYRATLAGGLENIEGIAGLIGVMEGGTALYLTDLADKLGFESGQIGSGIALLYECYENGIINRDFTNGLE